MAITGTTKPANLESNLGALDCRLSDEDLGVLNQLADKVQGDRYSPEENGRSSTNKPSGP